MKKVFLLTAVVCLIALVFCACNNTTPSTNTNNDLSNENQVNNVEEVVATTEETSEVVEEDLASNKRIAVVYFSATGNTKTVAEYIAKMTSGDIFEIVPKEVYTMDDLGYTNEDARATKEQNDKSSRPEIANEIDVSEYDVVFLGYPIWFSDTPRIIQTFIETGALNGKDVVPFCTSGSSGIAGSEETLHSYEDVNWHLGKRLEVAEGAVEVWMEGLKSSGIVK